MRVLVSVCFRPGKKPAVRPAVRAHIVELIAAATGETAAHVMDVIGVSQTTYRRKDEANEPLPDAAGHRVMGFLRVLATLRRLLNESGDADALAAVMSGSSRRLRARTTSPALVLGLAFMFQVG